MQPFVITVVEAVAALAPGTGGGEEGANNFLDSPIGGVVTAFCGAMGVIVGLYCLVKMITHVIGGKVLDAVKVFFYGLFIVAILMQPQLVVAGGGSVTGIIEKIFDSVDSVSGAGAGSGNG
ncbi:hypothetical protein LUW76_33845 [Actinomadura madurae]|uniref:hypothetical protein n=1 Tax=Actinomadura madurae TaxID=1993 RepID=UPI002026C9BD|nr:hypothetical protein [Actinomadura madurae]URM98918.1 hypothetical protein LUW76_33845 [Actinomadura madurae]URN09609.1 hypothetical protein LUW74_43845 [Actinomadura madurae]